MANDDRIYRQRLRLFARPGEVGVSKACQSLVTTGRPTIDASQSSNGKAWRCCSRGSVGCRKWLPGWRNDSRQSRNAIASDVGYAVVRPPNLPGTY